MIAAQVGPLLGKELRQVRRSRGALLSATLLPLLLMVITPAFQLYSIRSAPDMVSRLPPDYNGPLPPELTDPNRLFTSFLFPLFLALGGLVVPSVAATYTVVAERERRSIELLMALPVRVGDILMAKLLAMLVLAGVVVLPLFVLDAAVLLAMGMIQPGYALLLLMVLLSAIACSVAEGLVLGLLARDFRTANNLNGALLLPMITATFAVLVVVRDPWRLPVLSALLLAAGAAAYLIAMRWLTFERYVS
jgi:ABC-2 type transport system permease protein